MTPAEILRAAKALIADKQNWITGEYAKSSDYRAMPTGHPEACKFCAVGALARAAGLRVKQVEHERDFLAGVFLNEAASEMDHYFPHKVNDEDGHEAVMAMYDRAIELAVAADSPPDRGSK